VSLGGWFGLSDRSTIAALVALGIPPILTNAYTGIREVDRDLVNNARILGASPGHLIRHVLLPSALTWIFSSLRTSVGFAFIGAVVAEYLSSSDGMGHRIQLAEAFYEVHGVYGGMFVILAIALVIDALMQRVERRFSVWKPSRGV
jgi:NitT/TauT family transport system permease protein